MDLPRREGNVRPGLREVLEEFGKEKKRERKENKRAVSANRENGHWITEVAMDWQFIGLG